MNRIIRALIAIAVLTAVSQRFLEADTVPAGSLKTAVFAGGCFWCIQPAFDKAPGVVKTIVGYCGGTEPSPTYELVTSEKTNYRESLQVTYDPSRISFNQLLDVYWRQIDPTQNDGQFSDIGPSYRAAIFYGNDEEKKIAQQSRDQLGNSGKFNKAIATEILPVMKFWPAEDYHQQYYRKNPEHFDAFEHGSGRVLFAKKTWGEKDKEK
jgi:methionine-S-sulfoxide reductase